MNNKSSELESASSIWSHLNSAGKPRFGCKNLIEMVAAIIESFRKEHKPVLIVSHDLDFLYRQVDRYLVLDQGRLVADFPKINFDRKIGLLTKIGLATPEIIELKAKGIPEDLKGIMV